MKNLQKGSMVIILLTVGVLIVGGGMYLYSKRGSESIPLKPMTNSETRDNKGSVNTQQEVNSVKTVPSTQTQAVSPKPNPTGEATSTYINNKFGFKFDYPSSWKMTGEIGKNDSSYRPPYLFDEIIATENHPINRAGHISVLSLPLDKFMLETQKYSTVKMEGLTDLKTVNLQGKKFKLAYQQVQGSTSQQTDYVYALSLGDKTLSINFTSINTQEKQISKELELKIEQFVKTISSI